MTPCPHSHALKLLLVAAVCWAVLPRLGAQQPVAAVERWLATVDSATQQIVLSWSPSADSATLGYHICTGTPCLDYDTVFGRMDTTYRCADHPSTEPHLYRIHVFDSSYNVSSLTPPFGNMVLTAHVPPCETTVAAQWTPYTGMPGGLLRYQLLVRQEPYDSVYEVYHTTDSAGPLAYSMTIAEGATRVHLRVRALGAQGLNSESNTVTVERQTVDTANRLRIAAVEYDSASVAVALALDVDTSFRAAPYLLWRSVDGSPWRKVATLTPTSPTLRYMDRGINPYDSLHCYQLSVADACGANDRYSLTECVVVPDPPTPAVAVPNVVLVGADDPNGTFRPVVRGFSGDIYELSVYDRRGLLVYRTTNPADAWRPTDATPQGAYAYTLRLRMNDNTIQTYNGTISVIK